MSAYAPAPGPGQPSMNPAVQRLWNSRNELDWTKEKLNTALSERAASPTDSAGSRQAKDSEIKALRARVNYLEIQIQNHERELKNQDIQIQQHKETIRIQSDEITRYYHQPSRYESPLYKAPSQYISPQRNQRTLLPPSAYNQPPPTYRQQQIAAPSHAAAPIRYYHPSKPTQPQSLQAPPSGYGLTQPSQSQSQYPPDRPYNPGQNRRPNEALQIKDVHPDYTKFGTKCQPLIQDAAGTTSQNLFTQRATTFGSSVQRMMQLSIQEPRDSRIRLITPSPTTRLRAVGSQQPSQQSTPVTSNSSSGVSGMPVLRGPTNTPIHAGSVVSNKSRSIRIAGGQQLCTGQTKERRRLDERLTKGFGDYFDKALEFAYRHVNNPSSEKDSNLPQGLKDRLMTLSSKTSAARLMGSQYTRYFLVAKLIIRWIQEDLNSPEAFTGLSPPIDATIALGKEKARIAPSEQIRIAYRQDIATQYHNLMKLKKYQDFVNFRTQLRCVKLHNLVSFMMYKPTDGDWQDLHYMMHAAHRVVELQLTDQADYRMYWPKVNEPFDPNTMAVMNPEIPDSQADPSCFMHRRPVVKLGWCPQVTYRLPYNPLFENTLIKAGVLIRFLDA